jgi:RNA polymerase-associated protein
MSDIVLYEHPLSSYAQKIKIALREKGVAFTTRVPEGLGAATADPALAALNPRLEVPILEVGADRIFESSIILEYIEERWPEPALLPSAPGARAFARMTEEVCDSQYEAVNWGYAEILWFQRAEGEQARQMMATAAAQTRVLQAWLAERLGTADWFGGAQFGWADAAVAAIVNRSVHYGLGPEPGSALARWHQRLVQRPSVAQTFAEFDAAAVAMPGIGKSYAASGRRREYRDHRLDWMMRSGGVAIVLDGLRNQTIRLSWPQ